MKGVMKRVSAVLLLLALIVSMCPVTALKTKAAGEVSVKIVGFMNDSETDLRAAQLLYAKVEGYEGNTAQLTYKWINNLGKRVYSWWGRYTDYGTYLYVFNTHNMYYVQGTDGEQEIHNTSRGVTPLSNMSGRSHDQTFTGVGFAYAAVYDADRTPDYYNSGNITVEVYDGNTKIGEASYSGFKEDHLQSDVEDAVFGLFEGETIGVKDLLGKSAVVHINCVECSVTKAELISGGDLISISGAAPEYSITGLKKGVAQIEIALQKNMCKFHAYTSATASPMVHVFKKPTVTPGLTTLTLGNLDPDCTYYIDGVQGVVEDGKIVFEGLDPSTTYDIEVRGHYTDKGEEKIVYTSVVGTTLTPNIGAVVVRLDHQVTTYDLPGLNGLNLQQVDHDGSLIGGLIPLTYNQEHGNYTTQVGNGIYYVYDNDGNRLGSAELVINNTDGSTTLSYFTVTYDAAGGTLSDTPAQTIHYIGETIITTPERPVRSGYYFQGWEYNDSLYQPNQQVTAAITDPIVLTAKWVEAVDVYVNFNIHHHVIGSTTNNNDKARHNLSFTVDHRPTGSTGDYTEIYTNTLTWDGVSVFENDQFDASYIIQNECEDTRYIATAPTLRDVLPGGDYTITTNKSGYQVMEDGITMETDENGDIILNVVLVYAPENFDLTYRVELEENAKKLPDEDKPLAANVKVTMWFDTPYDEDYGQSDDDETVDWYTVTRMRYTYERVAIDPATGIGTGSYPVAKTTTDGYTYHYRIEVVSYELPDGTIMPATQVEPNYTYVSENGDYTARVEVDGGNVPEPENNVLPGAYFDGEGQVGTITAYIGIRTYTLILDANGGTIGDTENTTQQIDNIIFVPDISEYTPVRDGGYVFLGWFTEDGEEITEGYELTEPVTHAYAKWQEPLTITGTVTVENFYDNNGVKTLIPESARITETEVLLRRRLVGAENYTTVAEQVVSFDISQELSSTDFAFTGIPAVSESGVPYEYIVAVRQSNYDKTYTPEYVYLAYNVDGIQEERYAAKPVIENNTGHVDILLQFEPEEFVLNYQVDASLIQDPDCRPVSVQVVYESAAADDSILDWIVISQHTGDNQPLEGAFTPEGFAEGSDYVWATTPDGKYVYLYRLRIVSYTLANGTVHEVQHDDHHHFNIYYGDPVTVNDENPVVTARLSPLRYNLILDTAMENATFDASQDMTGYIDGGLSEKTEGHLAITDHYYGEAYDTFPTPSLEGYVFQGWYDESGNKVESISSAESEDVYLTAKWLPDIRVVFHSNNPDAQEGDVFRTYYVSGTELPEGENNLYLTDNNSVATFYDIPTFAYDIHNGYIFKGWYMSTEADAEPMDWNAVYTEDTHIYAQWIYVGTVAKEDDGKLYGTATYPEYDLLGNQIRTAMLNPGDHYGNVAPGLRFITSLSERVYQEMMNIHSENNDGVEYGFVIAFADSATDMLKYKHATLNGEDTTVSHSYVNNVPCRVSGKPVDDHYAGEQYRLYTAVITYNGLEGDALTNAQNTNFIGRAYMRYFDANGLERVHYNNYTGNSRTYGGVNTSYTAVSNLVNGQ